MSGEQRVSVAALIALIAMISFLAVASSAFGEGDDDSETVTDEFVKLQSDDGSWDGDPLTTTTGIRISSLSERSSISPEGIELAFKWSYDNYNATSNNGEELYFGKYSSITDSDYIHSQSNMIMISSIVDSDNDALFDGWEEFKYRVDLEILNVQFKDGSWNNDVGDTSIVLYARAGGTAKIDVYSQKAAEWLLETEDTLNHNWGYTISDDSKAILALDAAGHDMWEEIAALALKQRPDGSFGGIEDTSWAVMAMSTNLNDETMERMERAVEWLRRLDYDDNEDLANAALAEQYYEKAKQDWDPPDDTIIGEKGEGAGIIPPPEIIVISMFIISGLALGYYLFARIDREAVLSGIRKDLYTYIEKHPGEHLAHLTKKFGISSSSARYHLLVLEGMDQIVSHKNGKYKRFYINKNGYSKYTNGNGYKHIMSALKNITARRIVKFIISNPEANQKRVSEALKLHPSTVNWHAERLREAEVLSKRKNGKEIVYSLNEDVQVRKVIGILEGSMA